MRILAEKGLFGDLLEIFRRERNEFGAEKVHVFGSRARGENKPGSDFDLVSDAKVEKPLCDSDTVKGRRSGVQFEIWRTVKGQSFLDPEQPHKTIRLRREKSQS